MSYPVIFSVALVVFLVMLRALQPLAVRWQLVDHPDDRKLHKGVVPLIGGPAMFVAFMAASLLYGISADQVLGEILSASLIVTIGVLDDRYNLSVRLRFFLQALAILIMVLLSNVVVSDLGHLLGADVFQLYVFAIPFTVIAVIGAMNATNMIDGMDGLAGTTALICFLGVLFLYYLDGNVEIKPLVFVAVLIPFILCNIRQRRKVFMGDSGSMFIGFGVAWVLTEASQGEHAVMAPVTALWLFAIPLIDMWAIMYRRVRKGQSPFMADRDHLHHIFQRAGFSDRSTVIIMSSITVICAAIGIGGQVYKVPEWVMFIGFMLFLGSYIWGIQHAWIVLKKVRQITVRQSA